MFRQKIIRIDPRTHIANYVDVGAGAERGRQRMIARSKKVQRVQIPLSITNDKRLSWEARGVLALAHIRDGWEITPRNIMQEGAVGRDKAYRIIKEIREAGYDVQAAVRQPRKTLWGKSGYIYLMKGDGVPYFKIGLPKHPEKRLRQINNGLPFNVILLKTHAVENMDKAEAYWHKRFADKRAEGEWFTLGTDDVEEFCGFTKMTHSGGHR